MKTLFIFLCTIFIYFSSLAQEWTPEQKEVWKNVETYWKLGADGDIEGFISYFHKDFSGWNVKSPLPADRETRVKFVRFSLTNSESLFYDIKPLAIKIHDNIAIVHYYFTDVSKQGEKEQMEQGRWTDILIKQGDKWIMIGDHGGPDMADD